MKFSLIYEAQTTDATRAGDRKVFHDMLEQCLLAEQMGFDVVWCVEHTALTNYAHMSAPETFLAFLAGQEVLRADGPFRALTAGRTGRLARTLGDATLGIFVTHLAVLEASYHLPLVGGDAPAQSVHELVGRVVFVVIVSTALTLGLRRIPYVRRLV